MNPITIILMLFERFFPMVDSHELARIKNDAFDWWDKIDIRDESEDNLKEVKIYFLNWYAKIGLAVAYFFISKWLIDFLKGTDEELNDFHNNLN